MKESSVIRTSICKASVRIRSKLFRESSVTILCVLSNLSKPCVISYIFPLLSHSLRPVAVYWLSQKHSQNQTEELGSLIDKRKLDTRHKGFSDHCSELSTFSMVCLCTTDSKSITLQYKKWRFTGNDASCSLFKSKSGQPEERRKVK